MSKIKITVSPGKPIRMEVLGATGPTCLTEHAKLQNAIGQTIDRKLKPEYHQSLLETTKAFQ